MMQSYLPDEVDAAIERVCAKASGRTRYAGLEPFDDEVLLWEIKRLRQRCGELELREHLKSARRTVAGWPAWKRAIMARQEGTAGGTAEWADDASGGRGDSCAAQQDTP